MGGAMGAGLLPLLANLLFRKFGWLGIALAIGAYFLFNNYFSGSTTAVDQPTAEYQTEAKSDPRVQFVSFVLDDVQNTWSEIFTRNGGTYQRAQMVIFEQATPTGCGYGQSATGPFYCPRDNRVYLDLSFFRALEQRLGASGDFAQAYVIAHEVGHHVQNQLGLTDRVHGASRGQQQGEGGLSVRLELQADCFAGLWANATGQRGLLEQGDLEEAIEAAQAIGDDRLQKQSTGTVQPEKWTHGSSAQRMAWFRRGAESGNPDSCDTFQDATASR
jgi:uncharacterized protein